MKGQFIPVIIPHSTGYRIMQLGEISNIHVFNLFQFMFFNFSVI